MTKLGHGDPITVVQRSWDDQIATIPPRLTPRHTYVVRPEPNSYCIPRQDARDVTSVAFGDECRTWWPGHITEDSDEWRTFLAEEALLA